MAEPRNNDSGRTPAPEPGEVDLIPELALSSKDSPYPPSVGSKFYPDGRVMPFPGNTIICHVDQQGSNSDCFEALLDMYRDAPRYSFYPKITMLPPSSYHMTIFGGANDRHRIRRGWPQNLPLDTSMKECNNFMSAKLQQERFDYAFPLKMRLQPDQDPGDGVSIKLSLEPADDDERDKLAKMRRQIASATGLWLAERDDYKFHITLAYKIRYLTPEEINELRRVLNAWARLLTSRVPIICLGHPEFCTMEDMFAFRRSFYLSSEVV